VRLVGRLESGIPSINPSESICLPLGSRSVYLEGESVILLCFDPLLLVLLWVGGRGRKGGKKREGGREEGIE
jgi:hypothetical protein